MSPDPRETERLRRLQAERAAQEHELAEDARLEEERLAHERRSDKAAYLEEKLGEQREAPDE
jgi:hypothetical protein